MELDLHQLLRIVRHRWWILILIPLIAGGSAYYNVSRQTPMYQAKATMVVNSGAITGTGGTTSFNESVNLVNTYVRLIDTKPVRDRVEAMFPEGQEPASVTATSTQGALLIYVSSVSSDPQLAADTANAYVTAFQEYIADRNAQRIDNSRAAIDAQIEYLQSQVTEIDNQLGSAPEADRAGLQQQRQTLVNQISQLQNDAAKSEMQAASASSFVEVLDPAPVPDYPFAPSVQRTTMLGAFVGILLAVGVIALLEYLDNTVKNHTNIQHLTQAPLLSSIPMNPGIEQGPRQIYALADTKSASAEAVRLLRTNLTFAGVDHPIRSLAVTSSLASEGKSTLSANLAVAAASSGLAVALIDADLRKPTQHRVFGVDNSQGVTTYLSNPTTMWESVSRRVALPGLTIITSGPIPPNPSEMVVSPRFRQLVKSLEREFDLVIIDTPPVLQASDGLIVGSATDGILLVTRHGKTRVEALRNASGLIHQSGTRLIGVVVNGVDKSGGDYYGSGYFGTYYGHDA